MGVVGGVVLIGYVPYEENKLVFSVGARKVMLPNLVISAHEAVDIIFFVLSLA